MPRGGRRGVRGSGGGGADGRLSSHHNSGGGGGGGTAWDAAILASDRILSKEPEYRNGIRKVQAAAVLLADRIAIGGDVESALLRRGANGGNNNDDNEDEKKSEEEEAAARFLLEQRSRLKALAEDNVKRMRDIDSFIVAMGSIRDEVCARQQREHERRRMKKAAQARQREENEEGEEDHGDDAQRARDNESNDREENEEEEEDNEDTPEYERTILERIEAARKELEESDLDLHDEPFCRDIRSHLGEKEPKKKRRSTASRRSMDDDDDELEIVRKHGAAGGGADSEQSLRCPFTSTLFQDPVRNKVCGHTYSLAGFNQLMKSKGTRHPCPVPGCPNQNLDLTQIEEDVEMAMRVRRFQKRLEQLQRQRQSQEYDDDDDIDGDGMSGHGMTVIE